MSFKGVSIAQRFRSKRGKELDLLDRKLIFGSPACGSLRAHGNDGRHVGEGQGVDSVLIHQGRLGRMAKRGDGSEFHDLIDVVASDTLRGERSNAQL